MINIRDYLNLGIHRGFDACESMGGYTPKRFTANCANLCGNAVIDEKRDVYITEYPTNSRTVESLFFEHYDALQKFNLELKCVKKMCMIHQKS